MTATLKCFRVTETGPPMKPTVVIAACLILAACGQPTVASDAPRAPAPPSAPQASAPSSAWAGEVVPVGDGNPLGVPPAVYPPLPARFTDPVALAPKGWRIEHRLMGDLSGDGVADVVLILRQNDPANVVRNEGFGPDTFDTNPRLLIVGLGRDGGYDLVVHNHTFIARPPVPVMEDVLEAAPEIRDGTLSIPLHFFTSAGGWTMFNSVSRFRWRDDALRMIGHDYSEVARNTGQTLDRSVNFLTRRVSTVRSTIDVDKNPPAVWSTLPPGPLLTIDQVGDGLEYSPVEDDA